ncbi:MAG TPA: hypothetical protein VFZ77_08480 [Acidimicrobiales bacterium]
MGERIVRAWRAVRRPPAARNGAASGAAGFAAPVRRRRLRDDTSRYCGASGWQMRAGAGDGAGGAICPLCSQRVRTVPDEIGQRGIQVIQAHCA